MRVLLPVVMLLHGGCWRERVSLDYFGQAAQRLTGAGSAVWNVEYRRLGGGGGWPATLLDVAAATEALRALAPEYGLDLARLLAVGHSAGSQLALWLAGRQRLPQSSPLYRPDPLLLRGVVSLAGIPDLAEAAARGLCQGAPQELLGGGPGERPERYAQASPAALLPLGCPQVFIHGEEDDIVPLDYVQAYVRAAQARGEAARLETLPATGHFEPVVVGTPAWEVVQEEIMKGLEP
ncbi:MAG: alpha/beta hydrolase [Deinococcota bacterium]|nr:alpha/beta hydrolase [Deinococcota bacterium]